MPHRAVWRARRRPSRAASPGGARRRWRRWRRRARPGALPILCGGTGLYLAALTAGPGRHPRSRRRRRGPRRGRCWRQIGPAALHARLADGRPGDRRAAAPERRPAARARLGGLARHRAGPRRLAGGSAGAPAPWRFRADPARPAARRAAGGDRRPVRRDAGRRARWRRCGRCWRSASIPALPAMRAHGVPELAAYLRGEITLAEARGRARAGDRAVHQAAGDLVPPSHACADPSATHTIHARFARSDAIFGKRMADLLNFVRCARLTRRSIGAVIVPPWTAMPRWPTDRRRRSPAPKSCCAR